ncbi:MAG: DegT/DnrJ/EryC1/StrS family aminotransferase [Chlorobi bacterium]|nr:DegT/DnrJ/EryC1/StrS family aminotransferase [Chlorobiota bacterium]
MKNKPIYVTQPTLPNFEKFTEKLKELWENKHLTNNGKFHQELEQKLADFLGVKYISLFANGTLALMVGLQALRITGEVITTPYSFVATTHALHWNGIKPVFCDIKEEDTNLDPDKIEALITPQTTAILPVHVYGNPCNNNKIRKIADTYGLKIIYDAAHAFGVEQNGKTILNWGDLSILSFHATKTYNTFEGGAIICKDAQTKKRIDFLKNFGFADEETVVAPGINAKMNEVSAIMGLLQLDLYEENRIKRQMLTKLYEENLKNISGIRFLKELKKLKKNYSYFPVFIDKNKFGKSRNEVYDLLKQNNIFARKYFYPLISQFSTYKELSSAKKANLPVATKIADQVLCLPLYAELKNEEIKRIIDLILWK